MKIIISGFYGKMGQALSSAAQEKGHEVVAGIDPAGKKEEEALPVYASATQLTENADGLIDFSVPAALPALLAYAANTKVPLVLSVTGYDKNQQQLILEASKDTAIFKSANMSLGVAVLKALTMEAAKMLGEDFDIEITETHHRQKVDAPSGTALLLYDAIHETLPQTYPVYGREGNIGKRNQKEVGIHALRGGTMAGTHEVHFLGDHQNIVLKHEATDRNIFAYGALKALAFLQGKGPGLYTTDDLVKELMA